MAIKLWKFLNTDVRELLNPDTVDAAIDTTDTVMALAEVLGEQEIQDIAPWVEKGASFLEVLDTPEAELISAVVPFAKLATGLLKFYVARTKEIPDFSACVVLVCFQAYTAALGQMAKDTNLKALQPKQKQNDQTLQADLEKAEIDDTEAKKALVCFRTSKLGELLPKLIAARLEQAGMEPEDAVVLTERARWGSPTPPYLSPMETLRERLHSGIGGKTQRSRRKCKSAAILAGWNPFCLI